MLEILHRADGGGCHCEHCGVPLTGRLTPRYYEPGALVVRFDNDARSTWETTSPGNRPTCGAWSVAA